MADASKKNPHAVALGRLGGTARAKQLPKAKRREIARLGGKAKAQRLKQA